MAETIVTYEPDNSLRRGYAALLPEIGRELWANRWLTYQLFKRDFLTVYKQSILGLLWVLVLPLASVGTFVLLRRSGIFAVGDLRVPYPLYALAGMAFWQLFAAGLIAATNSLVSAGALIVKIRVSKKSLVIASAGQSLVAFGVQLGLAGLLFAVYGIAPGWGFLLAPLAALPILLLALGVGFFLALLNGVVRDIGNAISMLLTFFLFLTPVLYPRPETGLLAELARYNPMYHLVEAPRQLLLAGGVPDPAGYAAAGLFSLALFAVSLVLFHLTETRIAERI
jgi:lipopolysaccharide transport system permease protein